jgi:hypothetical protein
MFNVRVTQQTGESKEFPLEIYKSSIFVGSEWIPCASFFVPNEVNAFLESKHAGDTIIYAFHEGGVTRDSFECWDEAGEVTGYLSWELLINGKPCTHEEISVEMMKKLGAPTYQIPRNLDHKYRGCGNGVVTLNKDKNKVLDFSYTDDNLNPTEEQNISMCNDAGRKIMEDDNTVTYRANFSSYQICLY